MTLQTKDALLVLNAGSSSLKFRLFGLTPDLPVIAGGKISDIGGRPVFQTYDTFDITELPLHADASTALTFVLDWLKHHARQWSLRACAHRIVHGGPDFVHACELDRQAVGDLQDLNSLAPQHQVHNLAAVEVLWSQYPRLRQFGCFDTAFHASIDPLHHVFALPDSLRNRGIRRYGFHGLSYAWIARRLKCDHPALAKGRVVAAHLGNGASLCAMKEGRSIDTTMGLTALDGLPMGTRCGSLDPGAVLYMQQTMNLTPEDLTNLLYNQSGLLGLSGISHDVRALLESTLPRAMFALDYFAMKAAQQIAAMATSLGGLDGLVFTGGIGENAAPIREKILHHLAFLPTFETHIIAANEERQMALEIMAAYYQETVS